MKIARFVFFGYVFHESNSIMPQTIRKGGNKTVTTECQRILKENRRQRTGKKIRRAARNWELYLFLIPTVAYFLIFRYYPMYGIQIAFRNYKATKGITGSAWVGFRNFERFFSATDFMQLLTNIRIENAKQLLRDTSLSVIDIAANVGYDSCEHFIRKFRSATGKTPGEYRHGSLNQR